MNFGSRNCGFCSSINSITKNIFNNTLHCECSVCGKKYYFPLLKLQKKVIYLDQNFWSHSSMRKEQNFTRRADKLEELAQKQLIACPYSVIHDQETHLHDGKKKNLWSFIRRISREKSFYFSQKVIEQQIVNAFYSFINNGNVKLKLNLSDAIDSSIHDWDESLRVSLDWSITDFMPITNLLQAKEKFSDLYINALSQWVISKNTLEEDFQLEIYDHGRLLYDTFVQLIAGNFQQQIESEAFSIINLLLTLPINEGDLKKRSETVKIFLKSEYFSNIPHVNISAGIWSLIKQEIKKHKQLPTNIEVARKKIAGLQLDLSHLSIFAPYCDAVFTEKRMARFLREWNNNKLGQYSFKVFSVDNWGAFDNYLEEIEKNISSEMRKELEIVYE